MTAEPVRFGLLSTARIARNAFLPAFAGTTAARCVAIASRDRVRAEAVAREHGIPRVHDGYAALLADPEVEAVIVPLPNSLHEEWTVAALRAGKHVLCEKPLATDPAAAERMFAAAAAAGRLLLEGFMYRFHPQHAQVRALLDDGAIGEPVYARAELTYTLGDWDRDVRVDAALGGGALFDAGCYCVDAVRFLFGAEPLRAQAAATWHAGKGVDDALVGILHFPGGRLATVVTGMRHVFRNRYEVIGSAGSLLVDPAFPGANGAASVRVLRDGTERRFDFAATHQHRLELEHMAACVRGTARPLLTPAHSIGNARALAALADAARSGGTVEIA